MKWLIIQSDGHHKGQDGWTPNWYLRECYAIQHALQQNQQTADIWGLRHSNFTHEYNYEEYDVIFCIENYEFEWLPNFNKIKKPIKIQWIIDLHCQKPEAYQHVSLDMDVVLHSTKHLIPSYQKIIPTKKHLYFPNAVDDRFFINLKKDKIYDFSFVGSKNPTRKDLIEYLETSSNLYYKFATGIDMINIISQTKVHFNKSISCDVNYRNFETIGLGTCLCTNYLQELEDLGFIDNYNCILYKSEAEIPQKVADVILNNKYKFIAENAEQLAKEHTYVCRINELLSKI